MTTDGGATLARFRRADPGVDRGRGQARRDRARSTACRASASWSTPRVAADPRGRARRRRAPPPPSTTTSSTSRRAASARALGDRAHAADDGEAPPGRRQGDRRASRPPTSSRWSPTSRIPTRRPACCWSATRSTCGCKAFSALRKRGFLHVFAPLRDNALAGWLRAEAQSRGIDIKPDAANALATLAGPDLGRLAQALEQLAIYVGGERADRRRRRRGSGRRDARARASSS